MGSKYDIAIIGSGPAGIFCALKLMQKKPNLKVVLFERGPDLDRRDPAEKSHRLYGFAGAGAFSDGKLTLSQDIGGDLKELLESPIHHYIEEVDNIFLDAGSPKDISGDDSLFDLEKMAVKGGLSLIPFKVRHIGTDLVPKVMSNIRKRLLSYENFKLSCDCEVWSVKRYGEVFQIEYEEEKGLSTLEADQVVIAVGRGGGKWLNEGLPRELEWRPGSVDIGVRLETPKIVLDPITDLTHDPKLILYSSMDDRVRTFCVNPGGKVSLELNDPTGDPFYTINGHSKKLEKTEMTNMALLVTAKFTEPFNDPFAYGKSVAHLTNLLGGKALVQRVADYFRGRRSTGTRIARATHAPTLLCATPGDISFALPYRQMKAIEEMVLALEEICPGVISESSYLYATEAKFYGSRYTLNKKMESTIPNLYITGDCSGWTRGMMQASVSGIIAAEGILRS